MESVGRGSNVKCESKNRVSENETERRRKEVMSNVKGE